MIRLYVTKDIALKCPDIKKPGDFVYNSKNLNAPTKVICDIIRTPRYTSILMTNPLSEAYTHDDRASVKQGIYE